MYTHHDRLRAAASSAESAVRALYDHVIAGWNQHDAAAFAAPFAQDGEVIGCDGSVIVGQAAIATTLRQVFADHETPPYVVMVRSVRLVSPHAALLRAIVGMAPPGQEDLNPALNAQQTLLAAQDTGAWRVALLQTTPAQLHGRPDLVVQMTDELRAVVAAGPR